MDLSLFSLTTFKFFHLLLLASTIFTTSHRRKEVKWWFSYNRLDQSSWLGKRAWWMSYSPGPLSHTALGYFNSSGGWCYLRICIFCVPSGQLLVLQMASPLLATSQMRPFQSLLDPELYLSPCRFLPIHSHILSSSPLPSLPTHTQLTTALLSNQAEQAKACGSQRH